MNVVAMILIGIFGVIAVLFLAAALFLADVIMTVKPYFEKWLRWKLDKAFEPRECGSCKHCATDYSVRPERHYCIMNGKNILRDSSCDRWERR